MFEYMWYTCGVWWIRLKSDTKYIVLIISCYVEVVGACLVVLEMQRRQLQFRHMLRSLQSEAMELGSRLRETGKVCNRGVLSF